MSMNRNTRFSRASILGLLMVVFLLVAPLQPALAAGTTPDGVDQLMPIVGDALVSAGQQDWTRTRSDIDQIQTIWQDVNASSPEAKAVTQALTAAEQALQAGAPDQKAVKSAISELAKSTDAYVTSTQQGGEEDAQAHRKVEALLPFLQQSLAAVQADDWTQAKEQFGHFVDGWTQAEGPIRQDNFSVYGKIEAKMSAARITLSTEPANAEKATTALSNLKSILDDYLSGKAQAATESTTGAAAGTLTITDLIGYLHDAQLEVKAGEADEASEKIESFITNWPSVEGVVSTRSTEDYTSIENKMTEAQSLLLSSPPDLEKAGVVITSLQDVLAPYADSDSTSYTAWDAGLILFREGLEAILVIAALLAFLNRTGNADKRGWVWGGAGGGIIASGVLAIVLTSVLSLAAAGSSRELIEGVTGLIAVLFMVTVGAWLHSKSNLRAWNQYIEKTLGTVVARGALWSLAATSFLAVMREGAETIIFYLGMAPSIATSQLVLGIGVSLVILAVIGFAMIRLSKRIPIRPFFLVASLLLYYLAFKFVGMSIHALQVAGKLGAHVPGYLPNVPALGIYPTWETVVPQLVVLAVVVGSLVRTERKNAVQAKQQSASA
ncbi:MAG TPA: FTR1 family protein [Bacilli bacterium]|nr:FTR1 family protein [Bacilli bacterium]